MTIYTAYLPPEGTIDNQQENFRLIPDGKATLALVFPLFWLAWHRLWMPFLVYCVVIAAIIVTAIWNPSIALSNLSILTGIYLLLEGYQLVRQNLESKGWQYAGVVEGETLEEAEIRFLANSTETHDEFKPDVVKAAKQPLHNISTDQKSMSLFPE